MFDVKRLDELCHLVTDGTHDTPKELSSGVPFIKGIHVKKGRIDFDNCEYISQKDHDKIILRSKPEYGDILLANIGVNIGETGYVSTHIDFSIKNVALFKPNKAIIGCRYLYYLLTTTDVQNQLKNRRSGSAQPFLSLENLRSFSIRYHKSLKVQKKIASILSAFDDLIDNNLKCIKLLEEAAELIYREWFVNLRFPGHESVTIVDGVPEGWNNLAIKDLLKTFIGGGWGNDVGDILHNVQACVIRGTDFAHLRSGNFSLPLRFHKQSNLNSRILEDGDLILEVSNGNLKKVGDVFYFSGFYKDVFDYPVICASFCKLLRPIKLNLGHIVFLKIQEINSSGEMDKYKSPSAAGINNFNLNYFINDCKVLIPDEALMKSFSEIIPPIFNLISILQMEVNKLSQLRDQILPELMDGNLNIESLNLETLKSTENA